MSNKTDAVIIDMDGVLACNLHRIHHVHDNRDNPDWESFYEGIREDAPLPWCDVIRLLDPSLIRVILTNRPKRFWSHTVDWLNRHAVPYDVLLMRPEGELYQNAKKMHLSTLTEYYNIQLAIDDDPEHVSMYEEAGIPTCYVHSGYYDEGRVPDDKVI